MMDRDNLLDRLRRERTRKNAISPIIATLLLILIAIAAGVVVYAYVLGFVGNSTGNTGANTSQLYVQNFCASITTHCTGSNVYSIVIQNTGSAAFPSGNFQIYFQDLTASGQPTATVSTCSTGSTSPSNTVTCSGASWPTGFSPSAGDTLTVKVVAPDGGQTSSTTKTLS
jgi:flagellin-like protein